MNNLPKHLEEMRDEFIKENTKTCCGTSDIIIAAEKSFNQAASIILKDMEEMAKALEFYGDIKVNYYMRNDSLDEMGRPDGFVNWTDREVDRGELAREALKNYYEKYGGAK